MSKSNKTMHKNKKSLRFLFIIILLVLPVAFVSGLFIPDVQKYIIKNQLTPWVSDANVDYIHITPFSIRIDSLSFKYEAIDITIDHLESELSPLSIFEQRIKIDKLLVAQIKINDASIAQEDSDQSAILFPGLFPYLDTGFILDIGLLDIKADYHSLTTGPVTITLSAQAINETSDNPIRLKINARELPDIPDVQSISLDSAISLQQHIDRPIDALNSEFTITLNNEQDSEQQISLQLAMKQLAMPNRWDSFPFDKNRTHYLQKLLHPESIKLKIKQSSADQLLLEIEFDGKYNGNEGIISGNTTVFTSKDFLQTFKTLKLPKVKSHVKATLSYNTRQLQGYINLTDEITVENYTSFVTTDSSSANSPQRSSLPSSRPSSLPEVIELSNHLIASIDEDKLVINSLLLTIINKGKDYIKILTHKPIAIDLNDLGTFLEQENSDLMDISINQIPLIWLNDFLPEHTINTGIIDANINLAIDNNTLKLTSNRPINVKQLTLIENIKSLSTAEALDNDLNTTVVKDKEHSKNNIIDTKISTKPIAKSISKPVSKPISKPRTLLENQNLEADFIVTVNKNNLNANISKLLLSQTNKDTLSQQASASLTINLKNPLDKDAINNPSTLKTSGHLDIHALIKTPLINDEINKLLNKTSTSLKQSLPQQLALNYEFSLAGESALWTINKSHIKLAKGSAKKKTKQTIFQLNNIQAMQIKQEQEQIKLITVGQLISAQINQFNVNWLSPVIQQFASPYQFSGYLNQLDLSVSAQENKKYQIDINQLKFSQLESFILNKELNKELNKSKKKTLFKHLNINSKLTAQLADDKLSIHYPSLTIKKNKTHLIKNSGRITINHLGDQEKQSIAVNGNINGSIGQLMNLNFVKQFTTHKLTHQSLLDAKYSLTINNKNLTINKSEFKVHHPQSKGQLILKTLKPISLSLNSKKYNFSQNGQLSFKLENFDIRPYESLFPDLPVSFEHANGHFDLLQTSRKQKIMLKEPFVIKNIHYKEAENALLNPFDITLDFAARQNKNITQGEIKQLSINFINDKEKEKAFDLQAKFKLDLDKDMPLSELNGNFKLKMTQWLNQPAVMPDNALSQGTLKANFAINKTHHINHQWLINNLVDNQGEKIVDSIAIDGTGQLDSLSDFKLTLPVIMKSISGQSNLTINTHTTLSDNKKITMSINGQEIYLNDLLKLLATINPQSEIAQLENENKTKAPADNTEASDIPLDKTPAEKAFWSNGFAIATQLTIDKLYYSDYMSYQNIMGELTINDEKLHAKNFNIKFHDSPMHLDALFTFNKDKKKPYDITLNTSLSQFNIGEFLQELNPQHIPRADGVFDVDIHFYGDLSNLSQIRNELLFDINIEGKDGVYHLIPSNDVMMRSSGAAMAVVGEVVSVLPTAGFGLGIVNRVIRFAKDINYDFINMHLVRQKDLNTSIETFQILSPELRVSATGGLTFKDNTRLFDQPLEMTANMNLAGEGAAIFYGLGLLNDEQDEYGFWKGPVINFSGTLNHQEDNFDEIISQAKSGTLAGGITNPFSGLIGNFRYRWFDEAPDYSHLKEQDSSKKIKPKSSPLLKESNSVKESVNKSSFFDETF